MLGPSSYKITPYMLVDGVPTFKDSLIMSLFAKMRQEGTVETVFYDVHIKTPEQFLVFMKHRENQLFVIHSGDKPAAIFWINRILDKTCYCHFCGFKDFYGPESHKIGRMAMGFAFGLKDIFGIPVFETILGLIPTFNLRAIKWLKKVGLEEIGIIPHALWSAKDGRSVDGLLLYITKDHLMGNNDENL